MTIPTWLLRVSSVFISIGSPGSNSGPDWTLIFTIVGAIAALLGALLAVVTFILPLTPLYQKIFNWLHPVGSAFARALQIASEDFERHHPGWTKQYFDHGIFKGKRTKFLVKSLESDKGVAIREKFLEPDGTPTSNELATCWADFMHNHSVKRLILIRDLEPEATQFLCYLAQAFKTELEKRGSHNDAHVERLISNCERIHHDLSKQQTTSEARQQYLESLTNYHRYLDRLGTPEALHQGKVDLDAVYISLQAQHEVISPKVDTEDLEEDARQIDETQLSDQEREQKLKQLLTRFESRMSAARRSQSEVLDVAKIVNLYDRLVILGEPGSGKSTLLQYLAFKHAEALSHNRTEVDSNLGLARFPILIRLADYAQHGKPEENSLKNYLCTGYHPMPGCPQDGLQDLLETELAEGNCLILLDGYDEVIQAQDREKIAERIDEFVNDYPPLNRFLVTSRIIGYHSVPLRGAFLQYTLQPMDKQQVREFLRRWCPVIGKTQDSKVDRNMIEETRETLLKLELTSPGMEHLISNPLLLRKMAFIYRPGVTLPTTRVELYQMVTETMASWRKSQNEPTSALVTETYLTPLLSELAYWIQHNSPTGIATIKDICNEFSKHPAYFKKWAEDNHLPWDQENPTTQMERVVQNFLEAAKQRTGLLVEQEPNCYSFTHRPFQEYYAARYLTSSDTRIRLIRDHLHDPYWDQPIILTIGFVGWKSSVEKTTELIERAILEDGAPDPDPYEDLIGRNYVFTLRCLADHVPINDNLMERLITRLTKELLYEEGSAGFDRYQQSLQERLKYLRGSPTAAKLLPKLVNATVDADADVRLRAITALGALRQYSPQLQKNLITELQNGNPAAEIAAQCLGELGNASSEVRNRLVRALRDPVRDKATRKAAADALGKLGRTSPEAVQDLLATMKDINASVHELVEATLKNLQYPTQEVIKILLDVLGSTNIPSIRSTLITILSKWGQVIPNQVISTLLKDLQSKGTYVSIRAAAAKSLGELLQPSPEVVTTLLGALHDRDSSVGKAAAKSLGELHYPTTITSEKLIKILELVLKGVTEIPEEMRSPTTELEKWIETLKDERRQVHEQAPGNPQEERYSTAMIVKGLTDILKCLVPGTSIYKDVAKEVAKSLEEVRYPTAIVVNELIKILEMKSQVNPESGPEVRQEAATTLGNLAQKFPELTLIYPILDTLYNSTLSESNPGARFAATMSLGKLKDTSGKVVRGLIGGLRKAETKDVSGATTTDLYAFARAAAAENLERWGQISSEDVEGAMEGVVKELRDALHDKDLIVCLSAARSLSKLQPSSPDAQEVLLKALTSPENSYRRYSAALLGQFGMYNESTLQILWGELPNTSTKLASGLRDEDPEVASTCAQALAQIVRRFPDRAEEIQSRLAEAIRKREFDPRILPLRRSAHNYAFEALWLLVVGGTLRKQPSLPYSLKEPPTNR